MQLDAFTHSDRTIILTNTGLSWRPQTYQRCQQPSGVSTDFTPGIRITSLPIRCTIFWRSRLQLSCCWALLGSVCIDCCGDGDVAAAPPNLVNGRWPGVRQAELNPRA